MTTSLIEKINNLFTKKESELIYNIYQEDKSDKITKHIIVNALIHLDKFIIYKIFNEYSEHFASFSAEKRFSLFLSKFVFNDIENKRYDWNLLIRQTLQLQPRCMHLCMKTAIKLELVDMVSEMIALYDLNTFPFIKPAMKHISYEKYSSSTESEFILKTIIVHSREPIEQTFRQIIDNGLKYDILAYISESLNHYIKRYEIGNEDIGLYYACKYNDPDYVRHFIDIGADNIKECLGVATSDECINLLSTYKPRPPQKLGFFEMCLGMCRF